jgi:hypothetical protein
MYGIAVGMLLGITLGGILPVAFTYRNPIVVPCLLSGIFFTAYSLALINAAYLS